MSSENHTNVERFMEYVNAPYRQDDDYSQFNTMALCAIADSLEAIQDCLEDIRVEMRP